MASAQEEHVTDLTVATEDGLRLEAELTCPANAHAIAVLSHPHPLYGGDMFNPLIDHLFAKLPEAGIATLRYNFRGVGQSDGKHGISTDEIATPLPEVLDAKAAFAAVCEVAPRLVSVGWSFGGDVSLATDHPSLAAWVGIAAPLQIVDPGAMPASTSERPKLLLVPENDQFCSPDDAQQRSTCWPTCSLEIVVGADHFLMDEMTEVAEKVSAFIAGLD